MIGAPRPPGQPLGGGIIVSLVIAALSAVMLVLLYR